ncbi:MAG TPA: diguanylate cyclase [Gemmatimonadaceae bacterium]|nr:diguanylate cyclase [Gemmatimonadaceae bacterium]
MALVAVEAVENVSHYLRVPRLVSIRSRILALAVLGTVIPAGVSLGVAYSQNRRAREDKIAQELRAESSQTAGAMGVWLKERIYDLRVFAGSDEVSNNLNRFASSSIIGARLREYLRSLHERFTDFEQLIVVDGEGRVLASSNPTAKTLTLPADWQKTLRQQNQLIGQAVWDSITRTGKLIVAVPVQRTDGRLLGAFAAELHLEPIQAQLRAFAPDTGAAAVYLATTDGAIIASSREISPVLLQSHLKPGSLERLTTHENTAVTYQSMRARGGEAIGALTRVPQVPWIVVAETSTERAFREVRQFRNVAMIVMLLLLVGVGGTAYALGMYIVRPLERLAEGAAEVASGDLQVDLPDTGGGEVGALTSVFNDMVKRLRAGRLDLERLSVTDGLTGLTNRRALMQRLEEESLRSARTKHVFSMIMVDVDHFKSYNDSFGHPAGDEVLRRVGVVLRDATRSIDCVGRYGGEEFAVLLPETDAAGAMEVAERIRARVEGEPLPERNVTVSLGVAEFPTDADKPDALIRIADAALYEAKHAGRNRAVKGGTPVARRSPRKAKSAAALVTGGPRAEEAVLPAPKPRARAKKKS